jgi:hypothetical protein
MHSDLLEPKPILNSLSWRNLIRLLRAERERGDAASALANEQSLHQIYVRLELQQQEIDGLKEALNANKKKKRKKKVLPLEPSDPNVQGGAFIVTLRSKRRSDLLLEQKE